MREEKHNHPAAPEQVDHGFDEGVGRRPRPPKQRRVGRFSDGIESEPDTPLRRGRFSTGVEQHPEPAEVTERRFSEGAERSDDGDDA